MKVTRTLHHSINVEGRLAETEAFYRRLMELPDDARPVIPGVEGHWFGVERIQLHLVDAPAGPGPIRPTGPHVCFAVADLPAAIEELTSAGIPFAEGAQGSTVQIWFVDPAGNTVEIQQDPEHVPAPAPPDPD
jgi:catechol 2,3-dioxygenase-like lactoylglutathione lyase family enzyme